jgi:hypothetical protein
MASIKVAVRCRPFTKEDKLGVCLMQNGDEEGEITLLNTDYTTTRFAFTWCWWSAYGFQVSRAVYCLCVGATGGALMGLCAVPQRRVLGSPPEADQMILIDQNAAYQMCGLRIKTDLLTGNAVVLFAYGLSGSGKTFTVFGVRPGSVKQPNRLGPGVSDGTCAGVTAGCDQHPRGLVQARRAPPAGELARTGPA